MATRLASALVSGTTWEPHAPERRLHLGLLTGALVTVAVLAGLSLGAGWRGAPAWPDGTYLVERETGTRYVVVDGRPHPVRNHVSALLITGRPDPAPVFVARAELSDPGPVLGIEGVPDTVPPPHTLLSAVEPRVPTGRAAVVRSGPRRYLVLDDQSAHLLVRGPSVDAATALGYGDVVPLDVDEAWLATFHPGPALDPARARSGS
jgi:hypothetical protein